MCLLTQADGEGMNVRVTPMINCAFLNQSERLFDPALNALTDRF